MTRTLTCRAAAVGVGFWAALSSPAAPPQDALAQAGLATLRLEAPLDQLFAARKGDDDAEVEGTLVDSSSGNDAPVPVKVSLRGHTSRNDTECTFPKLKIELPDGKALKIGTHCGDGPDKPSGKYGRVQNERAPVREAAVYRLLEALDVPTLKARPARITYVYGGQRLERQAMILEDDEEAIARVGGTGEIEAADFTTADRTFATADLVTLAFAEALIGNFDWCLKFHARDTYRCDAKNKLWNIMAVKLPGGSVRPLIHDFDLAGMVTGSHLWFVSVFNDAFVPSRSPREIEVIAQLQRTRSLFSRTELDAARRRFAGGKRAAYEVAESDELDPDGRRYMSEYLDAFYAEIEQDERFYRPVVIAPNTLPRAEPGVDAAAVCPARGAVPVGTPVSTALETRGDWTRVTVLDALWHWAPPAKCAPIQKGSVWVETRNIGRDYPGS
jgi:hypothetical protein